MTEEQRSRRPIFIPTLRAARLLTAALSLVKTAFIKGRLDRYSGIIQYRRIAPPDPQVLPVSI